LRKAEGKKGTTAYWLSSTPSLPRPAYRSPHPPSLPDSSSARGPRRCGLEGEGVGPGRIRGE
jgi:hypothetical protein